MKFVLQYQSRTILTLHYPYIVARNFIIIFSYVMVSQVSADSGLDKADFLLESIQLGQSNPDELICESKCESNSAKWRLLAINAVMLDQTLISIEWYHTLNTAFGNAMFASAIGTIQ